MSVTIIRDYCSPDTNVCQGKFIQLILGGRENLVFAPRELHQYHNQILAHFLDENGISCRWASKERLEYDVSRVRVVGGGRFRVDRQAKLLHLWDDSQVYGRFDENGLVEKLSNKSHPWSEFGVKIS